MSFIKSIITASIVSLSLSSQVNAHNHVDPLLEKAVKSDFRSEKNRARDVYRHPVETLTFFGFRSDMTVVELTPGGGWYTEILAPALKGKGKLYAAQYPDTGVDNYYTKSRLRLEKMLSESDEYSEVVLSDFTPRRKSELAPENSVDLVLTFRNLHNWKANGVEQVFKDAHRALKIGGILGVVEHRLPTGVAPESAAGYLSQEVTIAQAKKAGFELADSSEINANPKDTAQYPKGVWTLPPALKLGDKDKAKYIAIGESDRMTLKFVKLDK